MFIWQNYPAQHRACLESDNRKILIYFSFERMTAKTSQRIRIRDDILGENQGTNERRINMHKIFAKFSLNKIIKGSG